MKKILFTTLLLFAVVALRAQSISHIETTNAWYTIYDENGKRLRSVSTSQGQLMGYSATFYILKQGSSFYVTYDPKGKKIYTFSISNVGEILGVAGDTFTSKHGSWIHTWRKDGKKMSSRAARN